jgi:putative heme iron utilization protein
VWPAFTGDPDYGSPVIAEPASTFLPADRTPSHAERCRTLAARARHGTLCTLAREPEGFPFGSLVALACDGAGRPLLLLSELAEHTRNLHASPAASILVTASKGVADDPLAHARATLVGTCAKIGEDGDARDAFLAQHPEAASYASFKDFAMYRLEPTGVRYVGGFGRMSWVGPDEYASAEPDPLAAHEVGILQHMNDDHHDAVLAYARALAGVADATRAVMIAIDRYGFDVLAVTPAGERRARIAFTDDVTSPDIARRALVALVRQARSALPART